MVQMIFGRISRFAMLPASLVASARLVAPELDAFSTSPGRCASPSFKFCIRGAPAGRSSGDVDNGKQNYFLSGDGL
jgi:hypothetical protein